MRFSTLLAAVIFALPVLGSKRDEPAISTGPIETITSTPTINTPIASGSVIPLTPSSSVPTASGAPPAPTNVFQFAEPGNVTICQSMTFEWSFVSAQQFAMTLVVTNQQGLLPPNLAPAGTPLVSRTLTNEVSSETGLFVWQSADIPIGAYVVFAFNTEASFNGTIIASRSTPFYVKPGLDESCLNNTGWPSPSGDGSASQGANGSQELATKKSSMSPGAIAGTVVGVVGGVVLLSGAVLFALYRKKRNDRHQRSEEGPYKTF